MSLKYQTEIQINLPRDRVIELFDNPDNLYHWMDSLTLFKHISGDLGAAGALSELHFKMGKRQMVMQEEITEYNLPQSFTAIYRMQGVENTMLNTFVEHGETTIWGIDVSFTFAGFGMKLMSKLMPGMFKKQTVKNMQAFKKFAESQ